MDDVIQHLTSRLLKTVSTWTTKFDYHADFLAHKENAYEFVIEFSLPTQLNPIPKAKVKVFFTCKERSETDFDITFRFENQSLVHNLKNTIRHSQLEKWIQRILNEKDSTRDILFLGTEFEAERIRNGKIDVIFQDAVMNSVALELRKLNESLLSSSIDFTHSEASMDEKTLELLKNTMFEFFRGVDKNDMGVVSYEECREVLRNMEIELSNTEINNLMMIADKNNNGMIEYREFVPIGAEVLYGLLLKQQTEKEMFQEEEMLINQSVLILYNDEIHDLSQILVKDCKEMDEGETFIISTPQVLEVFKKHPGVLNEREYELLYKFIQDQHPEEFPYNELPNILLKYKVDMIKNGLAESNVTLLEQYLRKLFEIFDENKTGKISAQNMMEALTKAEKIALTQIQLYILRNFVKKDADNNIDYLKESKFLAEMIKKFFCPSVLKKQAQFIERGIVRQDTYMEGWTTEALTSQMNEIFQSYDLDQNKLLDKVEYKKLLTQAGVSLSDEEIYAMMQEADKNHDGFLDFNEFQSHFFNVLKLIRRSRALYALTEIA